MEVRFCWNAADGQYLGALSRSTKGELVLVSICCVQNVMLLSRVMDRSEQ